MISRAKRRFLGLGAVGRWVGPMTSAPAPRPLGHRLAITAAIDNARTDMTNRIARIVGGQAGALSAALVTGKRGLLEERVNDDLRASGLYHIVSISACTWCWRPASSSGWRGRCWR